jgi:hypothetical protein
LIVKASAKFKYVKKIQDVADGPITLSRRWEMFYAKEIGEIPFTRGVVIGLHNLPFGTACQVAWEDYIRDPLSSTVG